MTLENKSVPERKDLLKDERSSSLEQSRKSKAARFKSITAMDRFNENFMNAHGGGGGGE
jgi:hypothetical protein